MSKPAARLGDPTVHGGVIVVGEPTVLIGGAPAARVGDMHTCPIPGAPPPPHVGGPITLGSFTVLIGGKPAARMGDMCTCTGPPDSIAMGCPTVLIGDGGGGGGAGMAGGGGQEVSGEGSSGAGESERLTDSSTDSDEAETKDHYLDVNFVDKGGKPISGAAYKIKAPDSKADKGSLFGKVKKTGVKPGSHEIELKAITKVAWSKRKAREGEVVKLQVETAGIESGAKGAFEVWERNINDPDKKVAVLDNIEISGDKLETEWRYVYLDEEEAAGRSTRQNYFAPSYYFTVKVDNLQSRSPLLEYKDFVELNLKDAEDRPIANARYRVILSNGEVREGKLDSNGYKKIQNVPPGRWSVEFPEHGLPDEE